MPIPQIVDQSPATAIEERLLVIAEAVQEIKDWISLRRRLLRARIVTGGDVDAIMDWTLENVALQSTAIDAALALRESDEKYANRHEAKPGRNIHSVIRISAPAPDRAVRHDLRDKARKSG